MSECTDCGGVGGYTTEGSQEACEAAGLVVLESFDDGTCFIKCPTCKTPVNIVQASGDG